MSISADDAARQAANTAGQYARSALHDLADMLGLDADRPGPNLERLAPFALVWAAMIQAAATDFQSAIASGVVEGTRQERERRG